VLKIRAAAWLPMETEHQQAADAAAASEVVAMDADATTTEAAAEASGKQQYVCGLSSCVLGSLCT
jgi:hypothetical protein